MLASAALNGGTCSIPAMKRQSHMITTLKVMKSIVQEVLVLFPE